MYLLIIVRMLNTIFSPSNCEQKASAGSLQIDCEDMAMVGVGAMQDANSTLEDFVSNTL